MAEFPCLPFYTDAYLADTRHLTAAQHGAYLLLLMTAWRTHDCSLPNDDAYLARCSSMDARTWAKNKDTILAFFKLNQETQKLYQSRLVDERKFADVRREQSIQAGKASALKRKERHSTDVQTPVQPKSNPPLTPYPLSPLTPTKDSQRESDNTADALSLWNKLAGDLNLPKAQILTQTRKAALKARLSECGNLAGWNACLEKIRCSAFLRGENGKFTATLDWVIKSSNFTKIMEGNYDDRKQSNPNKPSFIDEGDRLAAKYRERAEMERREQGEPVNGNQPSLCAPTQLREDGERIRDAC